MSFNFAGLGHVVLYLIILVAALGLLGLWVIRDARKHGCCWFCGASRGGPHQKNCPSEGRRW